MRFPFAVLALALFAIPVGAETVALSSLGGVAYEKPELCGPDAVDMSDVLTRAMAARGNYLNQHEYVLPNGYNCFFHPVTVLAGAVVRGAGAFGYVVRTGSPANNEEALFSMQNSSRLENLMIFAGSGTSGGIGIAAVSGPKDDLSMIRVRNVVVTSFGDAQWWGAVVFDGSSGPPAYGQRSNIIDSVIMAQYRGFGIKIAGQNSSRFSNMDLVELNRSDPRWIADLWMTGSATNPNNVVFVSAASIDQTSLDWTNASTVIVGGVAEAAIGEHCNSTTIFAAYLAAVPTFGSTAANCVVHGGRVTHQSPN